MTNNKLTVSFAALALMMATPALAGHHEGGHDGDHKGKKHEKMFEKMDTDGDGKISKDEFMQKKEKYFSEMDANGDGFVTKEEKKEAREKMKEKWKAKKAEKMKADGESGSADE